MKLLLKSLILCLVMLVSQAILVSAQALDENPKQQAVSAADIGESWPFTVDSGIVECIEPRQIVFHHDGVIYALNGEALSYREDLGWRDPAPIQKDITRLYFFTSKAALDSVIEVGLSLCDEESPFTFSMQPLRNPNQAEAEDEGEIVRDFSMESMTTVTPLTAEQRVVRAVEQGENWPFTVNEGIVECVAPRRIVFHYGDVIYALNGDAMSQREAMGWQDPAPIQRDITRLRFFTSKAALDSVVEVGLSLCAADTPFQSAITFDGNPDVKYVTLNASDIGDSWPFTVYMGVVECVEPRRIVFHHEDVTYALNGEAMSQREEMGWQDPAPIQRDITRLRFFTSKAGLDSVVEVGLSLCDEESPFRSSVQGLQRNDSD